MRAIFSLTKKSQQVLATIARILKTKYKIIPKRIIAAGRSQYVPMDDNKTKAGRLNNRRISIVIMLTVTQVMNLSK